MTEANATAQRAEVDAIDRGDFTDAILTDRDNRSGDFSNTAVMATCNIRHVFPGEFEQGIKLDIVGLPLLISRDNQPGC